MFQVELLFIMQVIMTALLIVLMYRLSQMKRKVEKIINEVQEYINFITEEVAEESLAEASNGASDFYEKRNLFEESKTKALPKEDREEAQTRLIQAVLGEYFP